MVQGNMPFPLPLGGGIGLMAISSTSLVLFFTLR